MQEGGDGRKKENFRIQESTQAVLRNATQHNTTQHNTCTIACSPGSLCILFSATPVLLYQLSIYKVSKDLTYAPDACQTIHFNDPSQPIWWLLNTFHFILSRLVSLWSRAILFPLCTPWTKSYSYDKVAGNLTLAAAVALISNIYHHFWQLSASHYNCH